MAIFATQPSYLAIQFRVNGSHPRLHLTGLSPVGTRRDLQAFRSSSNKSISQYARHLSRAHLSPAKTFGIVEITKRDYFLGGVLLRIALVTVLAELMTGELPKRKLWTPTQRSPHYLRSRQILKKGPISKFTRKRIGG